jgi:hypothetical protein
MNMLTQRLNKCAVAVAVVLGASTPALADKSLEVLPLDAEFIGSMDLAGLQNSALYKNGLGAQLQKNGMPKELQDFQTLCGIDPQKAITRVTFGIKREKNGMEGVFVLQGVQKVKAVGCYDKVIAKINSNPNKPKDANVSRDGDILLFKSPDRNAAMMFTGDSTALVVVGAKATKDGIKEIAKGGSQLKNSAAFNELYKKTNTGDTVWCVANGSSSVFDGVAALGFKPRAVFGSIGVSKDLNVDVRFRMKTAGEATNLQSFLNQQSAPARGFVDKLNITTEDKDVRVVVSASEAKIKAAQQMLGPMLGGGGGGKP